ncbi:hypothetical protein ABZX40_15030 [Streptomyces sp. NPDC004610]|uniref:hypothetical protein n=1 Tax=unclassified Streptomyces TaxID=2593676 RepID=UPI0033BDD5ED
MDIPDWLIWTVVALAVLQALALVPLIRRLRGADPARRAAAGLDLADAVGSLLLFAGIMLSLLVSDSWFPLALTGFAVMAGAYTVKGVRLLRARRRAHA